MNILVILTANEGCNEAHTYPACLSEVDGVPIIEQIIKQIQPIKGSKNIYAIYQSHVKKFHLSEVVKLLDPEAIIYKIENNPEGNACTALMSWGYLDKNEPLLIIGGNSLILEDFNRMLLDFMVRQLDGGVVVFNSIDPRRSYVRLDKEGLVEEVADHRPISKNACADFYFFRSAGIFLEATQSMIRKDARSNGYFPIAPIFNQMLLDNMRIGIYSISRAQYIHPNSHPGN